MTIERFKADIY